uniref:Uncharacterized protein n=1 Tax=Candidatus Kentrum sp. LPFa TaxID=2126335 RepID=A0A450WVM5_9GAMM|nr:MAG: hypothetical protein BECKLPF1236A_GA0070988_102855 [Candidatus Kentron sp. LPFa]VFK34694.1 MAG: hypothetical protein BECKLPF1236C_GA0070990_102915 [Candidatus Kentron sp. LPFa]
MKRLYEFMDNYLKANLVSSYFLGLKTKTNSNRSFPVLLYGKSSAKVASSASIKTSSGTLYFNTGTRYAEPFPGILEMLPNRHYWKYLWISAVTH